MFLAPRREACSECGDRFVPEPGDHCGRCHRRVCRACSHKRGRWHETVLCVECAGDPKPTGLRATPVFRAWRRMVA